MSKTDASINAPLLDEGEIRQLISAAPAISAVSPGRAPRQGRAGERIATGQGSGMDFAEVRAYQQGDDPRQIDWRASARSNAPLIRTRHADVGSPLCLLIDRRASMRYGTRRRLKVTQALRAALWLCGRESRGGGEIGALLLDSPCHWLPAQRGEHSLRQLIRYANAAAPPVDPTAADTEWKKILSGLRQRLPEGSALVMLSDFSGLQQRHQPALRNLASHCNCLALRITEATELELRDTGPIQLHWAGNLLTGSSHNGYINKQLEARRHRLSATFAAVGIDHVELAAEQDQLAELLHGVGR